MPNRKGGPQRKTRHILKRSVRGRIHIRAFLQKFKVGDNVQLVIDSGVRRGMFPLRFHGRRGKIMGQRGRSYQVEIKDQNKHKELVIHPSHLKKV